VPRPRADDLLDGQVLLRVLAGGICRSDLPHFAGRVSGSLAVDGERHAAAIPGYPMHEVVGSVVASRCHDLAVDATLVGWASGTNALAEFVAVDGAGGERLRRSRDDPHEAITLQPLACVLFTVAQLGALAGKKAAVLGQGPIGVLFSHVLRSAGAGEVVGVDVLAHTDLQTSFGVDEFVHSTTDRWAATLHEDERPDVIADAAGHQVGTLTDAVAAAVFGGCVFYFGVTDDDIYPVSTHAMPRKNLTLMSGYVNPQFRREALAMAMQYLVAHPGLDQGVAGSNPVSPTL
jgi:L-iditol 2-dehydrogenase